MYKRFLNSEVTVYCVVPYSTYSTIFEGTLLSEDMLTITLASVVEPGKTNNKYSTMVIRKDTIISIGQK